MTLLHYLTVFHTALSVVAIISGLLVVKGLIASAGRQLWTLLFVVTAIATTVTGFFFPFNGATPAFLLGVISLVPLWLMYAARYRHSLAGKWRGTYVISSVVTLYFNLFVLVVQAFQKVPALYMQAPTQRELPFVVAQIATLLVCILAGALAFKNYRPKTLEDGLATGYVSPHALLILCATALTFSFTGTGQSKETKMTEKAILAGGCFWGMEELFRTLPGVIDTEVGYTGGDVKNATYENHGTHAEAIKIVFDPSKTSYRKILEFFFQVHDPTTMNRQGNDRGTSYRSAIFYVNDAQKKAAETIIKEIDASKKWPGPVVTQVVPASDFWSAEAYHQDYLQKNPGGYTCHFVREKWKL